jgi:hypothetical protein
MVSSKLIIVFVLPIIFSIIFGSAVMVDILQKPDRELNMWPMSFSEGSSSPDSSLKIIVPGFYQMTADIVSNELPNISTSGTFTIK